MKIWISASALLLVTLLLSANTIANTCTAKRVKVKQVCGIVVDGLGRPLEGVSIRLVSDKVEEVTAQVITQDDGRFSLPDAPEGSFFLAHSSKQWASGRWPIKVTGKAKDGKCEKPLKVHLSPANPGWGCLSWVDHK